MESQTKTCQNCKKNFTIESEDFAFYEKMKVPAPTWCPECRLIRRLCFFNERTIYKRKCDLCDADILSLYPKDSKFIVYCSSCYQSDKWDPYSYGQEVDFSRPFLEQVKELFEKVPVGGVNVTASTMQNSSYCNCATYLKNCYLLFNSDYDEDSMFSTCLERSKWCLDIYMSDLCEFCYEGSNLFKCFQTVYSRDCNECMNVSFCRNLIGCSNCFGCINLRNKQYYIFNEPYSKEEYLEKIAEFNTGSQIAVEEFYKKLKEIWMRTPRKFMTGLKNHNAVGDYIFNSKNVKNSYEVAMSEDCKYCHWLLVNGMGVSKNCYDYTMWGGNADKNYECMATGGAESNIRFSSNCWTEGMNIEYCKNSLMGGFDLFGCAIVKEGRFCILNKQYSEKEYNALREKIIEHMDKMPYVDKKGRVYKYGEFFPSELSPFCYNESLAQIHFPLTREEALEKGFEWRDPVERSYKITLNNKDIPDDIKNVSDKIFGEVIECGHKGKCNEQCATAFIITASELEFYRKINVPLPRFCPSCRHYMRLRDRNPINKLWHRQCMCDRPNHGHEGKCSNEFETSYAPDSKETIYCESCYSNEVA